MPRPNAKAKMTGDTHLPEIESELPAQTSAVASSVGTPSGRRSRGFQKAGLLKTADDESGQKTADDGNTNQSGHGS